MYKNEITQQCESMSDEELISALTVDKHEYSMDFHNAVQVELKNRNIEIENLINMVRLKFNDQEEEIIPFDEAIARLNQDMTLLDVIAFTNIVGETLIFQKQPYCWIGHYLNTHEYEASFFLEPFQDPKDILSQFLKLDEWDTNIENEFQLLEWSVLVSSDSFDYIEGVSQILDKLEIPSVIKNINLIRVNPISGRRYEDASMKILVSEDTLSRAKKALKEIDSKIESLYQQASECVKIGNIQKEFSILSQLVKLVPNDKAVLFNMGVALFELGRHKEAADALIAALINNRDDPTLLEDSIDYLKQISVKLPNDIEILHNLATFSRSKGEDTKDVIHYYRKILAINPSDSLAHLNLGYLCYEDDDDVSAYQHFKKYLELEPESEERSAIESIIKQF